MDGGKNRCMIKSMAQNNLLLEQDFPLNGHCNILTSDPAGLSDEKCTSVNNRCIRSKISRGQGITLTVDRLN